MINSVLSQGIQGVNRGMQGMARAAERVAKAGLPAERTGEVPASAGGAPDVMTDLTTGLVELRLYSVQVEASAKVVKTADQTLGTLLDVKA